MLISQLLGQRVIHGEAMLKEFELPASVQPWSYQLQRLVVHIDMFSSESIVRYLQFRLSLEGMASMKISRIALLFRHSTTSVLRMNW